MRSRSTDDKTISIIFIFILLASFFIFLRLAKLQLMDRKYYSILASNAHEIYKQLYPRRGSIYMQDTRTKKEYPVAINRPYYILYADPREIPKSEVNSTTEYLSLLLQFKPEEKDVLLQKLSKEDDPYEPVAKKVSDDILEKIKAANLPGIHSATQEYRYYPENNLAAQELGFLGMNQDGTDAGRYGIEGFWNKTLAGASGFLSGERGAFGSWIPLAGRTSKDAEDGADLLLTLDRTLEYKACERLRQGGDEFKAKSGALVIMDSSTGAILAMCSYPDFNPNNYNEVEDIGIFNNTAVFTAYEPGSVFKPITMAAALDLGLVNPYTTYTDTGERIINGHKIHNAENKIYGTVSMTKVLENSINTGLIWVQEKIGQKRFKEYVEKFGFGKKSGIALDTESAGDISSLSKTSAIYGANGSFGQGFTATPLQLATAYAALANNGQMPKPYIVSEVRYPSGRVEKTEPDITGSAISAHTDKLITGMLISVVENGHGKVAKLDDYYVAAKTGTAQIAGRGEYTEESNHTFVGYFPATAPRFVLLVKYEAPQRNWAEQTAAPVFKDVAKFTLDYFGVPGDRK